MSNKCILFKKYEARAAVTSRRRQFFPRFLSVTGAHFFFLLFLMFMVTVLSVDDTGQVFLLPAQMVSWSCGSERLLHCDCVPEVRSVHVRVVSPSACQSVGAQILVSLSSLKCQLLCNAGKRNPNVWDAAAQVLRVSAGTEMCAKPYCGSCWGCLRHIG